MLNFHTMPIKQKLTVAVLTTTGAALLLAGIGLLLLDSELVRLTTARDLTALARIVAENNTGAIAFNDPAAAKETLAALRARPHIAAACVYLPGGALFAMYQWSGPARGCAPARPGAGVEALGDDIAVWQPVERRGLNFGTLTLRYDRGQIISRRKMYVAMMSGILLAAMAVAFLLASRLREGIANPISSLAGAAAAVSQTRDFGIRAQKLSADEMGVLVDTFNEMLVVIQTRDQELQTALRAREEALREAETARNSLRTTLLSIGDAVLATDAQGRIVFANPVAQAMLRYPLDSIIGRPIDEVFRIYNEYSRVPVESPVQRVLRDGGIVGLANHTILVAGDGAEIPIDDSGAPIMAEGSIVGAVLVFRDVTERRRAERDTAFLAALVESSGDAIVGCTTDGIVQSWNAGAERLYGYRAEEMIGRPLNLLVPPDRVAHEQEILAKLRAGERMVHTESARLRKDGSTVDVFLTASPIRGRDGAIIGFSRVARDISEQKLQEERLRQTQKLESIGVLAGGIAHDFNNLLTGILGNASLAFEESPPSSPTRRRLEDVVAASEKAAELTRQMLAYSGRGQFVLDRIDLSARVRETLPLIQAAIGPSVQLRLDLADRLPAVEADPAQIQQLLMNLIINAAEAIPASRVGLVAITTRCVRVDDRQAGLPPAAAGELTPGDYVLFEVADNGSGMDEATKAKIFDPFFTTKFTGRGLGLAAVLGIVRGHKGCIGVESAPGQGATFRVLLPALEVPVQAPAAAPQAASIDCGWTGKVLVVDDEEVVRNMARQILERYRCPVVVAEDGAKGVEIFRQEAGQLRCVLLDLTMPVMGGEEALARMKAIRRDVPIILSSGYNQADAMRRFDGKGIAAFLQKPYRAGALVDAIRAVIGGQDGAGRGAPGPPTRS